MSEHLHYRCTRVPGPIKKKSHGWVAIPMASPVDHDWEAAEAMQREKEERLKRQHLAMLLEADRELRRQEGRRIRQQREQLELESKTQEQGRLKAYQRAVLIAYFACIAGVSALIVRFLF